MAAFVLVEPLVPARIPVGDELRQRAEHVEWHYRQWIPIAISQCLCSALLIIPAVGDIEQVTEVDEEPLRMGVDGRPGDGPKHQQPRAAGR